MKSSDEQVTLSDRLLLRHATRFTFEARTPGGLPDLIEADFLPFCYSGGGWRVRREGQVLCRKKADAEALSWNRPPHYDVVEVEFAGRDQAVAMALDIAEGRVVVVRA